MKIAMADAGISVQQMADYLGVERSTITRYTNDRGLVRRSVLVAWALATGVSLQWIETGEAPAPDGDGGPGEYGIRDSNPEPAAMEHSTLTWGDAA
jgi:transcriptional regulator with XRE-family HTH domain